MDISRLRYLQTFCPGPGPAQGPRWVRFRSLSTTHPFPIETTVECEFQLADAHWDEVFTQVTATDNGIVLPTQVEKEAGNLALDWRKRVIVPGNASAQPDEPV